MLFHVLFLTLLDKLWHPQQLMTEPSALLVDTTLSEILFYAQKKGGPSARLHEFLDPRFSQIKVVSSVPGREGFQTSILATADLGLNTSVTTSSGLASEVSDVITRKPAYGFFFTSPAKGKVANLLNKFAVHYKTCASFNLLGKCSVPNCTKPHICPICASAHSAAFSAVCRPSLLKIVSLWPEFGICGNCCCKT